MSKKIDRLREEVARCQKLVAEADAAIDKDQLAELEQQRVMSERAAELATTDLYGTREAFYVKHGFQDSGHFGFPSAALKQRIATYCGYVNGRDLKASNLGGIFTEEDPIHAAARQYAERVVLTDPSFKDAEKKYHNAHASCQEGRRAVDKMTSGFRRAQRALTAAERELAYAEQDAAARAPDPTHDKAQAAAERKREAAAAAVRKAAREKLQALVEGKAELPAPEEP